MLALTVGKTTNKELAEWFQVTENSFKNRKAKYLDELRIFAEFYEDKGKIIITRVLYPYYKRANQLRYEAIRDQIDNEWSKNGLDSCKRVAESLSVNNNIPISDITMYNLVRRGRNELYGIPYGEVAGVMGRCIYVWCKQNPDGRLEFLTDAEKHTKDLLLIKYFGNTSEKQVMIKAMIASGEIKKEEAWDKLEELTNMTNKSFMAFLTELQAKVGCRIIRGTYVMREEVGAFDMINALEGL